MSGTRCLIVAAILALGVFGASAAGATNLTPPKDTRTTASGLEYVVLKSGTGKSHANLDNDISVIAYGWTTDGKPIDSPDLRGKPYTYHLRHLMRGWKEAIPLMVVGETARFWMTPKVAFGSARSSGAPAGTLVFEIHLISIRSHHGAEQRPGLQ